MNWLRRKVPPQQAALCIDAANVHAVQVVRPREGLPAVRLCHSEPIRGNALSALQRMGATLGLQGFACGAVLVRQECRLLMVEKPNVPAEEVREAVRWRLPGMIDYPPEQAVVDTLPVAIDLEGGNHATSMYAVTAERQRVAALTEQFRRCEIPLRTIDVADLALRNLAALFAEPGAGVAMAWFDAQGSGIVFVAGGELCLVRHLDATLAEVREALASDQEFQFVRIELALQRALDHFDRNFTAVPINRLLLAPFADAAELAARLTGHLSLPVVPADLGRVLDLTAAPQLRMPERACELLVTLGAALRPQ